MTLPLNPDWDAAAQGFLRLLEIVATLRSPQGCPWDREQTPRSIAPYVVEEAHEVLEAVEGGDPAEVCEELGDMLLEVALLTHMAQEAGQFSAADVLDGICAKLIRRHPHVFGDATAHTPEQVRESWAQIKAREKRGKGALEGVPRRLPALHRARRVGEKAAGVGFDWPAVDGVLAKVDEELGELKQAVAQNDPAAAAEELGDTLFALVNLARHLHLDPEAALHGTIEKFLARFAAVEQGLAAQGLHPTEAGVEAMEEHWLAAKARESATNERRERP